MGFYSFHESLSSLKPSYIKPHNLQGFNHALYILKHIQKYICIHINKLRVRISTPCDPAYKYFTWSLIESITRCYLNFYFDYCERSISGTCLSHLPIISKVHVLYALVTHYSVLHSEFLFIDGRIKYNTYFKVYTYQLLHR